MFAAAAGANAVDGAPVAAAVVEAVADTLGAAPALLVAVAMSAT